MNNYASTASGRAAGFGLVGPLLFIILVGLIAAVVMHLMTGWAAAGVFVLAVLFTLLIASLPDLMRYIRISSM